MRNLLTPMRDRATRRVRTFLVGEDLPISSDGYCGDQGLIGPSSVSWMVLSDPSTLLGGLAAVLQQGTAAAAANPEEIDLGEED